MRRDKLHGKIVDDFPHAPKFFVQFAYPRYKETKTFLVEQFINAVTNVDFLKSFLTEEPQLWTRLERGASLKIVISYTAFPSQLDALAHGPGSIGS